jgi:cytochrome P450
MNRFISTDVYNNPRVIKGQAYVQLQQSGNGTSNLLTTLDKDKHRKKRRIIGPVVSERSMRVFEPEMSKQVTAFLIQLLRSSQNNTIVNMTPRCERLGVDVVGQLAFGYSLNTQSDAEHRVIVEGFKTRSDRSALYFFWGRLKILERLFDRFEGRQSLQGLYRSIQTMIAARMAKPRDALHDFYALTSGEIAPGEPGFISKELWAEAVFFIAAGMFQIREDQLASNRPQLSKPTGGSTTATAMSGVFFYLSRNPEAYARLASEIRTTFSDGREIRQGHLLSSCKYLRAIIDETMRMSPSTLAPAWREQDPASIAKDESFIVDGQLIPPGTQVAVSAYTLQHNVKYFPEPFAFRPDRWISLGDNVVETEKGQELRTSMKRSWAPFSLGDRSCAGKSMAYLEMSLAVARTLWYFDFKKAPGEAGKLGEGQSGRQDGRGRQDEFQLYDSIVVDHDGPHLLFVLRGEYWKELEGGGTTEADHS